MAMLWREAKHRPVRFRHRHGRGCASSVGGNNHTCDEVKENQRARKDNQSLFQWMQPEVKSGIHTIHSIHTFLVCLLPTFSLILEVVMLNVESSSLTLQNLCNITIRRTGISSPARL